MQQTAASAWRIWPSVREISWHPMPRPPELGLPRSSSRPDCTFMHLRHDHHHPRWSPLLNFLAFCAREEEEKKKSSNRCLEMNAQQTNTLQSCCSTTLTTWLDIIISLFLCQSFSISFDFQHEALPSHGHLACNRAAALLPVAK